MDRLLEDGTIWHFYESEHERKKYERRILEFLVPVIQRTNPKRLLEVGAGSGYGTLCLANLGYRIDAVDPFFRKGIESSFPFLHKGSGVSMPFFADQEFDFAFSLEVIEHVGTMDGELTLASDHREQRTRFVEELCRVTRDTVVLATPNKRFPFDEHGQSFLGGFRPHSPFEQETLSVKELREMFRTGGFVLDEYLDPSGYYAMERVERVFGPRLSKTANTLLKISNSSLLGSTMFNPHLFLSFKRSER